ncbi:flavin reductase family protein [Hongsoonwoonella zoysiae]|uniref:flavin reductase family protein n=1 Tax=Hongsoonwoonella zoysiae TaxID=2821844 RepID=UPI001AEDAC80|nr:flavin reductase family protein [Hongsoonwoonella zoysiae]
MTIDPHQFPAARFREALGRFATGVTIVTALDGAGRPVGLTANSFNSVSLDPPMVLWSLAARSRNLDVFRQASHFAINILAADQRYLSDRFARPVEDRFADVEWEEGIAGVPLISGTTAVFQCENETRVPAGDHVVFLGKVVAFGHDEKEPLIFHAGRYTIPHAGPHTGPHAGPHGGHPG